VYRYAQRIFNDLASAAVEKIQDVDLEREGNITLKGAEAYTHHGGTRRLFFRTELLRLTLDGIPLRDSRIRVMRVDLFKPEIHVRREADGEWNLEWALQKAPRAPEAPPPPTPEEGTRLVPWHDPDEGFPRNGVHIYDGTLHVTFASRSGKEVTWSVHSVNGVLLREGGILKLHPFTGDFYGGRMTVHAEIPQTRPLLIRPMNIDVRDADVAKMSEGAPFVKRRMTGRFNAVFALTVDPKLSSRRPIAAGHCEITDGDLWDVPALSGIIHLLALSPVSEKRIDTAVLEFTVEEGRYRIDKMHFLGYPVSLFGDGSASLTGDWIDVTFIPRLGKKDWNSILPVIGAPLDLLSNVFKGLFVPVTLKGSFENPQFNVGAGSEPSAEVRKLIEEKSPR
ncbi:MAG TPA: hypothetical protein VEN81_00325, partial [Planctomycetota bacterium]|nr:hypothetical protein [Planctomycetota bacterium]